MFKSIDPKSLVIGGILVLSVMCLLGATPTWQAPDPVGRFAIEVVERNTYVLDTTTGQVWAEYGTLTDDLRNPKTEPPMPRESDKSRPPRQ